jgi:hypothetical protein
VTSEPDPEVKPESNPEGGYSNYVKQQRKKKLVAHEERDRVLQLLEHDKAERRQKRELARSSTSESQEPTAFQAGATSARQSSSSSSKKCALQVRLLDGSSIRSHFPKDNNLSVDVRKWVDGEGEGVDVPYVFKQIMVGPARTIGVSEESETLQELGLTPSATLVIVPVQDYTSAYGNNQGYVSRAVSGGYGLVTAGLGAVTGLLGSFIGYGSGSAPEATEDTSASQTAGHTLQGGSSGPTSGGLGGNRGIRVRTLRDQRQEDDRRQNFYNGNQVG